MISPRDRLSVLQVGKFYPPHWGGIETYLHTLCTELKNQVNLSVLVSNSERQTLNEVVDDVPVTRLSAACHVAGTSFCPSLVDHLRSARDADIIHLHLPNPAATMAYLYGNRTGKLVISYHSDVIRQKRLAACFEPMLQKLLHRAEAILVTSPNYIETSEALAPHKDRCHVVPLGILPTHFEEPSRELIDGIRRQFGEKMILAVGRLVYYKGFEYLIRALQQVPDGHLVLVGHGPLRKRLELLAKSVGVADRVTFLGSACPALLHACYYAANVFVLPSLNRSEAFGLVQVEAMAARRPVINTQLCSGVPFVSPHEVSGLTVPPADPDALARAINRLLDNPELSDRLGRAGRDRAEKHFSSRVMGTRTLQVYQAITGRTLAYATAS